MKTRREFAAMAARIVAGTALAGLGTSLHAWPDKPLKLVVPYTAGGSSDQMGRALAEYLRGELGQAVVVENRPGANTAIAATQVANAPAKRKLRDPHWAGLDRRI